MAEEKKTAGQTDRRGFLGWVVLGWSMMFAFLGATLGWCGRFLYPRAIYEQSPRFNAGFPAEFPKGTVKKIPGREVYLVHYEEGFGAIIGICTHLGCRPNWLEAEERFRCPCHGSVFDKYGVNIAGPAPRPLDRAKLALSPDGRLEVDMSEVKKLATAGEARDPEIFFQLTEGEKNEFVA